MCTEWTSHHFSAGWFANVGYILVKPVEVKCRLLEPGSLNWMTSISWSKIKASNQRDTHWTHTPTPSKPSAEDTQVSFLLLLGFHCFPLHSAIPSSIGESTGAFFVPGEHRSPCTNLVYFPLCFPFLCFICVILISILWSSSFVEDYPMFLIDFLMWKYLSSAKLCLWLHLSMGSYFWCVTGSWYRERCHLAENSEWEQTHIWAKFLMCDQTDAGRVRHCKTSLTCNIHIDHELTGQKAAWSFKELQSLHGQACARKSILKVKLTLISSWEISLLSKILTKCYKS